MARCSCSRHQVDTTPQVWIDGQHIGGYEQLREYFGDKSADEDETTYRPVLALFAISMTLLALQKLQKLQDVESFSSMFLNYDLLARRWVRYSYLYPYGEVSVFKAVYIDRRELKCACVGGNSNVPLGFISLTENLMMIFMGIWMPARMWWG